MSERTGAPFKINYIDIDPAGWLVSEWEPRPLREDEPALDGYVGIAVCDTWAEALETVITEWDLDEWDARLVQDKINSMDAKMTALRASYGFDGSRDSDVVLFIDGDNPKRYAVTPPLHTPDFTVMIERDPTSP